MRGMVFGPFEYTVGILQGEGGESADEEDVEDGCLAFGTGAGALEMTELGAGESGISADVCTCLGHDLKDADPGGVGAGISVGNTRYGLGCSGLGQTAWKGKLKFLIWLYVH